MVVLDLSSTDEESSDWDIEDYIPYNGSPIRDSANSALTVASSSGTSNAGQHGSSQQSPHPIRKPTINGHSSHSYSGLSNELRIPSSSSNNFQNSKRKLLPSIQASSSRARPSAPAKGASTSQVRESYGKSYANASQNPAKTHMGEQFSRVNSELPKQTEAVRQFTGSLTKAEGFRFAIVVARFNEIVTKPLLEGALGTFKKYSVREEDIDVFWVPGSFEIGVVAQKLGKSGKYNSILCIGAVIRDDTTHYDAVANTVASGVLSAGLNSGVPCIFGVLTCEDMDQALNRAGGKAGNKGSEAALTAIEMASLFEHHLKD